LKRWIGVTFAFAPTPSLYRLDPEQRSANSALQLYRILEITRINRYSLLGRIIQSHCFSLSTFSDSSSYRKPVHLELGSKMARIHKFVFWEDRNLKQIFLPALLRHLHGRAFEQSGTFAIKVEIISDSRPDDRVRFLGILGGSRTWRFTMTPSQLASIASAVVRSWRA
jgi:hypothetical protein